MAANYHRTRGLVGSIRTLLEQDRTSDAIEAVGREIGNAVLCGANLDRRKKVVRELFAALEDFHRAALRIKRAICAMHEAGEGKDICQ